MSYVLRQTLAADAESVAALQRDAFPAPFPTELLWQPDHIRRHVEIFPDGQYLITFNSEVVASCTNCLVSEKNWGAHLPWHQSIVDLFLSGHDSTGTTLYGVDVTVHPEHRQRGLARTFYQARFDLVRSMMLTRYGTACRLPDFSRRHNIEMSPLEYALEVTKHQLVDRTLTPLLRTGVTFRGVIDNYMQDEESGNAGAILEWVP